MSDNNKVVDVILHCQKQIKKERLPEEKLLHYLGRLSRLRITVPDLAATGIGRTVNSLSRNEGPVGQAAETLVRGWKRMVSEQQSQEEPEPESEDDSDSNSGSSEDDDEEINNDATEPDPERYEIPEPVVKSEPEPYQDQAEEVHQVVPDPVENSPKRIGDFADEDEEEEDEIDDPYMDGGSFMLNVHTDEEEEEEEEDDENDKDSDASDNLRIADDEPPQIKRESEDLKTNTYIKQEPQQRKRECEDLKVNTYIKQEPLDSAYVDKEKEHKRSYEKGSHNPSHSSTSNSKPHHHHHQRSSSKDHSPSSKESMKEHKHKESKDHRPSKHSDPSPDKKSRHHHPSSSHHEKERSRSSSKDKHRSSKESSSSSSHREVKSEKERSKEKKDPSYQNRSSSSSSSHHHSKDKTRKESSLNSSSPVRIKSEFNEERKRKDQTDNGSLTSSSSKKSKLVIKEEIDSTSGVNFSDVLGSLDVPSSSSSSKHKKIKKEEPEKSHDRHESRKRKRESPNSSGSSKHSQERESRGSSRKYEADSEVIKLSRKPMHAKIEGVIKPVVDISPNYKPMNPLVPSFPRQGTSNGSASTLSLSHAEISDMGNVDYWDNQEKEHTDGMSQEDAISTMLSNRNARSKVFSGVKSTRKGGVPKLYDLCMQVIKDNIGDLGYTGGIPYDILKPALERANPHQLMNIESQNDHLIGETDELWQFHCKRDFRGTCPEETESWRELYERCKDGQQQRFEQIKKKMKLDRMKKETAEPQRKTKLAFIDTSGGPRFHKEKAQTIKNGMKTLKIKEEKGGRTGATSSASAGFNNPKVSGDPTKVIVQEASVIIAAGSRSGHAPAPSVSRDSRESTAKVKPRKAPLMQKTMKLIRSLNRR